MLTGDQALSDLIRHTIRRTGPVRFDWFMEQALYHPDLGYYSSGRCEIGRRGDYFTNVSVGPLFGRILAAQFAEMWELLDRPGEFTVVEQGAHQGDFARDVLEAAREAAPDFFASLRYCVVEPFPVLEARQQKALADFERKVSWRTSLEELEMFRGVHFSNELLDSMPVRLVRHEDGDWREMFVTESDSGFGLVAKPIADDKLQQRIAAMPEVGEGRYETEINLAALDWIERVARRLERGFVLTVDYGYPGAEFNAASRSAGTLQAYAKHRQVSSPLQEVGRVDITAHVEWTSVVEHAEEAGLRLLGFTDQHHFITGLLAAFHVRETERRMLQTLLHPEFLGTRFQYLALGRNVPDKPLSGFQFGRDPRQALGLR